MQKIVYVFKEEFVSTLVPLDQKLLNTFPAHLECITCNIYERNRSVNADKTVKIAIRG